MAGKKMKSCTYSLDQATLDRIEVIREFRRMQGTRFAGKFFKKSSIVRDAVFLLYNFEVLGKSIVHSNKARRKGSNANDTQEEQN